MKQTITIEGQTFVVEVGDLNTRPIRVMVDGQPVEVWLEPTQVVEPTVSTPPTVSVTPVAKPVQAAASGSAHSSKSAVAPIPGVILRLNVQAGDAVAEGQELCVLEAMKMKNSIRASRDGKIAVVHVAPGDQVRQNQPLMDYSD